jgi:two-component system, NarL family, response regulator DevR
MTEVSLENRTSVLIFCCNRLLRESVARILNKRTDFQVVASQAPAPEAKVESVAAAKADVVVLDSLQLLDEDSIFGPNRRNVRLIKCVLVAMEDDRRRFLTAIRLGVLGYVLQDASAVEVITAIRAVAQGESVCPSRYARVLFDYFVSHTTTLPSSQTRAQLGLTRREQELVPMIDRGMTNKEIASQLNISEQTVKNHIHRILRKVGVEDRLSVFDAFQAQTLGL